MRDRGWSPRTIASVALTVGLCVLAAGRTTGVLGASSTWQLDVAPSAIEAALPTTIDVTFSNRGGPDGGEDLGCVSISIPATFTVVPPLTTTSPPTTTWKSKGTTVVTVRASSGGDRLDALDQTSSVLSPSRFSPRSRAPTPGRLPPTKRKTARNRSRSRSATVTVHLLLPDPKPDADADPETDTDTGSHRDPAADSGPHSGSRHAAPDPDACSHRRGRTVPGVERSTIGRARRQPESERRRAHLAGIRATGSEATPASASSVPAESPSAPPGSTAGSNGPDRVGSGRPC